MAVEIGGGGGGGGTLSEIYQGARKLLMRARDGLERLERLDFSSASSDSHNLSSSLSKDISQIQSSCLDMDRLCRSVGAKSQRDLWKRKIEQVAEEAESLKQSLDKYLFRNQKRVLEAKERADLLQRSSGDAHIRIFNEDERAMQSLEASYRAAEETNAIGEAILLRYSEQGQRLKRAHRKVLDVVNTVGLSNSLLKLIEKRNRVDKLIKYAGMIFTVIVVIWFWRLTR